MTNLRLTYLRLFCLMFVILCMPRCPHWNKLFTSNIMKCNFVLSEVLHCFCYLTQPNCTYFILNLIVKKGDKLSYLNTYLSWDLNILQSTLYSPTFKILLEETGTTENPSITDHQNMTSTFINITQTTGIRNRSMRTKSHTNISCRDCSYILFFFCFLLFQQVAFTRTFPICILNIISSYI